MRAAISIVALYLFFFSNSPALANDNGPTLVIERFPDRVVVAGDVSSPSHEAIIRQTVADHFPTGTNHLELKIGTQTPRDWTLLTQLVLVAVSETQSSNTVIKSDLIEIRGITARPNDWLTAINRVNRQLSDGMRMSDDITVIQQARSLADFCKDLIDEIANSQNIEFAASSSTLGSNAISGLDALVELATDCNGSTIHITGHTDSTGFEPDNVALSKARAEAVATYLVSRGVSPDRLAVRGAGSSDPVAEKSSGQARQKNRRIEFSLSFDGEQY